MMKDKRKAPRRQMRYSAWLAFDGDESHVCALNDISETGARLDVDDSNALPDRFILLLSANGAARRHCQVVWRQPRQIGVHFEPHPAAAEKASLVPALDPDLPSQALAKDPTESA
jgi:hypothetical protein